MDTTKIITKIKYGNTELPLKTLNLQSKTITPTKDVQHVLPDAEYAGFSDIHVVAIPDNFIEPTGTIEITENGTHDVSAYSDANVNVPIPEPNLQEKTATENGEVTPDEGYDGLSKVIVSVGDKSIILKNIPEVFQQKIGAYYFALNDDELLYSTSVSNSSGTGLWHYRVSTSTWTLLFTKDLYSDYQFSVFYQIDENRLIVANENSLTLIYEHTTNTVRELYNSGLYGITQINDDKLLLATRNGKVLVYYIAEDRYIENAGGISSTAMQLNDTKWVMLQWGSNTSGIFIYNSENDTVTQVASSVGVNKSNITKLTENKFRIARWIYNINDDTGIQVFPDSTATVTKVSDVKWLCATTNTYTASAQGLFVYNVQDDSCVQINSTLKGMTNHYRVSETKCLVTGRFTYAETKGVFLYNSTDDSVVQIYTETSSSCIRNVFTQVTEDKCIIAANGVSSSASGLLLYNVSDDSCVKFYTYGNNYANWYQLNETEWLCYGSYNPTTSSVTMRYIYLYNSETDTITSTIGNVSDKIDVRIVKDGDDIYMIGTKNEFKLKFDESTKKFNLIEYKLEG